MNADIQVRMLNAVYACLLPIARLLLRSGVTYQQFEAVAKRAFVREAMFESPLRSRPMNTSRISVKTGLSRKDVKRLREQLASSAEDVSQAASRSGPPARVLHAWHVDPRFIQSGGLPRDLQFQNDVDGFSGLVRSVAGDVPAGAVRAELRRSGAIEELPDGQLRVVKRHYVPGSVDEKAITVMSGMVFPLASGIVHNSDPSRTTDGFIQRFAFSEALPSASINEFRRRSRVAAEQLVEQMDDWLADYELQSNRSEKAPSAGVTAGIGVFYYEGPNAEQALRGLSETGR
jgi:hypothetical protein